MRDFVFVRDKSTTLGDLIDIPWQSVRCHSTIMAQITMASPQWRRSSLAHSGMARSSTAQFRCGAVSVWRMFHTGTTHFSRQFKVLRQHWFAALFSSSSVVLRG